MDENGETARFDNSSAGTIANSLFLHQKHGIYIEYSGDNLDSYQQFIDGHIKIMNNVFYMVGNNSARQILGVYSKIVSDVTEQDSIVNAAFEDGNNLLEDPLILYNPQHIDAMNLLPSNSELGEIYNLSNRWFEDTDFKGAFGPDNWLKDWSILHNRGLLLPGGY
jgi:hypothetical protein